MSDRPDERALAGRRAKSKIQRISPVIADVGGAGVVVSAFNLAVRQSLSESRDAFVRDFGVIEHQQLELGDSRRNREPKYSASPKSQLSQMRTALDSDRKRTPISNIVVRCSVPQGLNVVVTLRTANLRDLTLSELDKNNVTVIGRITRVLPEGQAMSSFENYGMALLSPDILNDAFSGLKSTKELTAQFSDIQVAGPAWQTLPLMIFVQYLG